MAWVMIVAEVDEPDAMAIDTVWSFRATRVST